MARKNTTADILNIAGVTPEVVRISMKIPKPGGRNAVLTLETARDTENGHSESQFAPRRPPECPNQELGRA